MIRGFQQELGLKNEIESSVNNEDRVAKCTAR